MSESADLPENNLLQHDLTSTLHLSSLKALSPHVDAVMKNLSTEDRRVLTQLPRNSAMLCVLTGPARGSRYLLDRTQTVIGRSAQADIIFDDITVSRKHAVIVMNNEKGALSFLLEDQRSLNGTYVDGVATERIYLSNGNEIHIGKYKLVFFVNDGTLDQLMNRGEK